MLGGSARELCIEQVGPTFRFYTGTCLAQLIRRLGVYKFGKKTVAYSTYDFGASSIRPLWFSVL